ncbi:MAG: hypothetical protein ACI4F0_09990 [Agathobacter sp.]
MELVNFLNRTFWGDSGYLILLMIAIFYILMEKEGEKRGKRIVIYSILVLGLIIWNPLVAPYGLVFFGADPWAYLRIFYLIPLMSILAYAGTLFYCSYVKKADKKGRKAFIAILLVLTVVLSGKLYDSSMYRPATNIYKIDQDAYEISNQINADCDGEKVHVLVPWTTDIVYGIRQYQANLIIEGSSDDIKDYKGLKSFEEERTIDYFVITKDRNLELALQSDGFEMLGETENCFIYKKVES